MPNYIQDSKQKMQTVLEVLQNELKNVNIGRANTALLEGVTVSAYGQALAIKAMANISIPDARQIAITPWDKDQLGAIETAIRESDLGVNPINDGKTIRINLPPMTEERRKDLVKQVKRMGEEARIELRNLRRDAVDRLRGDAQKGEATEDDEYQFTEEIDKLIKAFNDQVESKIQEKEKEIMTV